MEGGRGQFAVQRREDAVEDGGQCHAGGQPPDRLVLELGAPEEVAAQPGEAGLRQRGHDDADDRGLQVYAAGGDDVVQVEGGRVAQAGRRAVDDAVDALVKFGQRVDGIAHGEVFEGFFDETDDENRAQQSSQGAERQPAPYPEDVFFQGDAYALRCQRAEDEDAQNVAFRLRFQAILLVEEEQPDQRRTQGQDQPGHVQHPAGERRLEDTDQDFHEQHEDQLAHDHAQTGAPEAGTILRGFGVVLRAVSPAPQRAGFFRAEGAVAHTTDFFGHRVHSFLFSQNVNYKRGGSEAIESFHWL